MTKQTVRLLLASLFSLSILVLRPGRMSIDESGVMERLSSYQR